MPTETQDPTATGPVAPEETPIAPDIDITQTYVSVRGQLYKAAQEALPDRHLMWETEAGLETLARRHMEVVREKDIGMSKKTDPVRHNNSVLCSMDKALWDKARVAREYRSLKKLKGSLKSNQNEDRRPLNVEKKAKRKRLEDLPEG